MPQVEVETRDMLKCIKLGGPFPDRFCMLGLCQVDILTVVCPLTDYRQYVDLAHSPYQCTPEFHDWTPQESPSGGASERDLRLSRGKYESVLLGPVFK